MRIKIYCLTVMILAAFLAGAACFFPDARAAESGVEITFCYGESEYVYRQSDLVYDTRDHDTLAALGRRAFFGSPSQKLAVIRKAEGMGFCAEVAVNYVLPGLKDVVDGMANDIYTPKTDSKVTFDTKAKDIFVISRGKDGRELDRETLYSEVKRGLESGGVFTVKVPVRTLKAVTYDENVQNTSLKAKFTTQYGGSTPDRKSNVRLAMSKFDGKTVAPGESVSFNDTVGERTVKNGYKKAKIIVDGKYVDGIGGGVCQASTTLYNAVLLAGLRMDEWHRHTLKSGYVKPSFDAMVNSNGADMVFTNDTKHPLYIRTVCDDTSATVYIYGEPNKYQIEREYKVVATTPAKVTVITDTEGKYADKVLYDDESFYLKTPVDGIGTEGYLVYKKDGKTIRRELIRKDNYKSVDGVKVVGGQKRPDEAQEGGETEDIAA